MARAGLLNFWCYEDEEFALESGRLILRGTNGAGKSVTMQSFLPLVLDGDKRPHRLDPFGSRDRKIEYYLLGEDEHAGRIAYIWLEFHHPGKRLYRTIGIGLRAQKGAAQVQFWGFVLEDGRRVNRDFWLYDRQAYLAGEGKYPLDRKGLAERIGSGGQVVQEQGAYRDLVNKSLFGYYDSDAFSDLLQLLIQLRSPKLSKDFRPSAIYEILRQSLPAIHEDDLRPLSEVLEDMDQIADRLDELRLHRSELEKLDKAYDRYNRYRLYKASERYVAEMREAGSLQQQVEQSEADYRQADRNRQAAADEREAARHRKEAALHELDVLNRHEAIEKQRELAALESSREETDKYIRSARQRLSGLLERRHQAERAYEEAAREMEDQSAAQMSVLEEMETLAAEIEFAEHAVYHRYWGQEPPEDDRFAAPWRRDLDAHGKTLEAALQVAEAEYKEETRFQDAEKELGETRKERDKAERDRLEAEKRTESALAGWKEELISWKMRLTTLPIGEDTFSAVLRAADQLTFENRDFLAVRQPVWEAADDWKSELLREEAALAQQLKEAKLREAQLIEEKNSWEQAREPEPPRSASRLRSRSGRKQGQGAPLYEVCEFQPHLSEEKRNRIEATLAAAGLLDAWIQPDGTVAKIGAEEEETWFVPQPLEWGYTLADVLKPTPAPESGLTDRAVDAVLRTFAWDEDGESWAQPGQAAPDQVIVGPGAFRLGPLAGKSNAEEPARYIGKEARRRYRLAEIARLEQEIAACRADMEKLDAAIRAVRDRMSAGESEKSAFPEGAKLHEAWDAERDAVYRLNALLEQEGRMTESLRLKYEAWQALRRRLVEMTAGWTRLKRRGDLQQALLQARQYASMITELLSAWKQYKQAEGTSRKAKEEQREAAEAAEAEQELLDELEDKQRGLRSRIESLNRIIQDLGIHDLHQRIRTLNALVDEQQKLEDSLAVKLEKLAEEAGALKERWHGKLEALAKKREELQDVLRQWREEYAYGLVPEWSDRAEAKSDDENLLRLCREIVQQSEAALARVQPENVSSNVLDQYNAVKHLLMDYVLEANIHESTGRITVLSLRDRHHPQTPASLLRELDELIDEQSGLLDEKDRELFEEIILRSVGKTIRQRIQRAEQWVGEMNRLMSERDTSSGLKLQLDWAAKPAQSENELDTDQLVALLRRDSHLLQEEQVEQLIRHFRSRIQHAKAKSQEERESLRKHIYEMLDYREWFQFVLRYKKGGHAGYRELTDAKFNTMSGGEKAMSMYIPLFAATYSRYADASPDAPKLISLDEAFAGVDEENIRDLFALLTDMDFDYMMTSQVLWGCYDTVPRLAICEIYRPKDADFVTVFRYRWNGKRKELIESGEGT
jgi:uncharacterized protein (TIGR02680 family)